MRQRIHWVLLTLILLCYSCSENFSINSEICNEQHYISEFVMNPEIYISNKKFTFKVDHFDSLNEKYLTDTIQLITSNKKWTFDSLQYRIEWVIDNMSSSTGVSVNDSAIWLHPPRSNKLYKKLEFSPFPYVVFSKDSSFTWSFAFDVPSSYSIKEIAEWQGIRTFSSHYKISDTVLLPTPLGDLQCLKIVGECDNTLNTTILTSYFNHKYVFVRMEYSTVDNQKIVFDLIEMSDYEDKSNISLFPELLNE
ncbi:hypothetical protein [Marinigracilibium pacificum]|uniref:Uncharacterized protein n=1 Tax=Marinigracilibium pacificum TaxID=2729599 RepID=A0A848J313_9BACT|nr:hypothetical protein [Marinigracilibium pacificum]NMM49895.1 hypothetical protein [Marinigracilibium pacificum]